MRRWIPRSLFSRLALAFAVLQILFMGLLFVIFRSSIDTFNDETSQRLNYHLAGYLRDAWGMGGQSFVVPPDIAARMEMLTAYNPGVEPYLLDADGRILSHAAAFKPRIDRVDTTPFTGFSLTDAMLPMFADDPGVPGGKSIFSVATLGDIAQPQGYLYLVLGGREKRAVADMLVASYSVRSLGWALVGISACGILVGLLVFFAATRRLARLRERVEARFGGADSLRDAAASDEIAQLDAAFDLLQQRVDAQLDALKQQDSSRREMVRMVSHDLRTPLTTLLGYLDTLVLGNGEIEAVERARYLATAQRQAQRLAHLTESLFQLARIDCGDLLATPEAFDLGELMQDALRPYVEAARPRGIAVELDVEPGLASVDADIALIERVLENLYDNAVRHATGRVRVRLEREGDAARVSVSDDGEGINADTLARIVRGPFVSDNPERPWSGVGLAVARRIVELHGSALEIDSAPGKGTTLRFRLPWAAKQ